MSRYIDAEWLIKESMPLSFSVQKWVNEVQIMTAPSIDIVRCGECEYEPICNHSVQHTTHDAHSVTIGSKTVEWCSYGERKEK